MGNRNKSIAYVDRTNDDEIMHLADADVVPRRGERVTIDAGDGKGKWTVYDVRELKDPVFDAVATLERSA